VEHARNGPEGARNAVGKRGQGIALRVGVELPGAFLGALRGPGVGGPLGTAKVAVFASFTQSVCPLGRPKGPNYCPTDGHAAEWSQGKNSQKGKN
jgi:hypothetical protein